MVKNICQGSQPTHRQNSFFLSAPRMDFLFLLEKVKLVSSKSVSFSVVEKPLVFHCFLTHPVKILWFRDPLLIKLVTFMPPNKTSLRIFGKAWIHLCSMQQMKTQEFLFVDVSGVIMNKTRRRPCWRMSVVSLSDSLRGVARLPVPP